MPGLYSERFLTVAAAGVDVSWTVPVGQRAVVRCIVLVNTTAAAILAIVGYGSGYLHHGPIPAATTLVYGELRVPIYGGETIGGYVATGGATVTIAGYLFSDPSRSRAPDEEYELHDPPASPLPVRVLNRPVPRSRLVDEDPAA